MKIIGIGEVVWDCFANEKKLGGAPINFCYFAQQLGAQAIPITAIGKDALGDETLNQLQRSGLNLDYITRNDFPTGQVLVTLDQAGIPQYEIVEHVAWDAIASTSDILKVIYDADAVCWGSLAQRGESAREAILTMVDHLPDEALKVFDINIRQHFYSKPLIEGSLKRANVLKLNEEELPLLINLLSLPKEYDQAITKLIGLYGLKWVIFTQGAVCSGIYEQGGEVSHMMTPRVEVVDTVGAGDSFTASFVVALLSGATIQEAHRKAVEVSAYTCTQRGAINPLPEKMKLVLS
jgi:fructokinase